MKIIKIASNYCGGFKPPKGHLDTQMFPECEGYETDRNIVKKTVEKRKKGNKKKKKKKQASFNLKEYRVAQEEEYVVNDHNYENPTELVPEAVAEAWDSSEEDIKVNDDGEAFYAGKLIAQPDANYGTDFVAIRKWMEKNNYFPNVWVANDH
ncbi:MAG TPA: hypothetical protein VMV32_07355, partial [Ignavibacteriaceae bacterium]|nr:hypothetical protein [Ignavibacteriaceae bacterium]